MTPKTIEKHIRIVRLTQHHANISRDPETSLALRLYMPTAFPLLLESALALAAEVERLAEMKSFTGVRECKHGFAILKDGSHHCNKCPQAPPQIRKWVLSNGKRFPQTKVFSGPLLQPGESVDVVEASQASPKEEEKPLPSHWDSLIAHIADSLWHKSKLTKEECAARARASVRFLLAPSTPQEGPKKGEADHD